MAGDSEAGSRLDSLQLASRDLPPPTVAQLRGDGLYGDDFSPDQVEQWFADDAGGYSESSGDALRPGNYGYLELNRRVLVRHLPEGRRFRHALGFGSGYGVELTPLASRIDRLTIIEAGRNYGLDPTLRMPIERLPAQASGDIPVPDRSVDLITSFNVLQYIANVSHVIGEFARVLEPGGFLLLREPVTSLGGGWGQRRAGSGVTPHTRGIPRAYLRRELPAHGLSITRETLSGFPLIGRLWRHGMVPYNSPALTSLDLGISWLLAPRLRYHPENRWQKLQPTGIAILARRTDQRARSSP